MAKKIAHKGLTVSARRKDLVSGKGNAFSQHRGWVVGLRKIFTIDYAETVSN